MNDIKNNNRLYAFPHSFSPNDIKAVRKKLKLTQAELAEALGVSKPTVARWESGEKDVDGPSVRLLDMWYEHPEYLSKWRIPKTEYPARFDYMLHDKVCATIEFSERDRLVHLINYTDIILFRPFGVNTEPTYEDFEEFLESRCFPRSRDKMKLVLKEYNIPFYDPMLIIGRTQGRLEEDEFWLNRVR